MAVAQNAVDALTDLREKIDRVDARILESLAERFKLTEHVGIYKLTSNDSIVQNGRWQEVLSSIKLQADVLGISPEMVEKIWKEIHHESVAQQTKIQDPEQ